MTFLDRAADDPNGLALEDERTARTWSELNERVGRVANLLRDDYDLGPGDHVAQLMRNRVEFIELSLGALLAGVWITPVNWHLTPDEIAHVLDDSGACVLFADPDLEELAGDSPTHAIVWAGDDLDSRLVGRSPHVADVDGARGGSMFYTSGTTGRPKGVKRGAPETVVAWAAGSMRAGNVLGLDGRGPHLVTGPLYHAAPVGFAVMDLLNGASVLITSRFDEHRTLELIEGRQVRHTHLVPTMFSRLLRLPAEERRSFDASSLDLVLHGAAPITEPVKRAMIDWWGPVLVEYWGASEGGVVTLIDSDDWLDHSGSVGRAIANHEVFAADDDGRELPAGETGLLWCRNKSIDRVFEYHNDDEKTAAAFREPGVYTIGDVGRVDTDGYVWLSDRKSNMIISGGVNIYPAEVERVLHDHAAVADVAVFGIPDDEWGESVKAAVELRDGLEPSDELADDILTFAREWLAGYKVPRSIDFHEALPRYDSGKIFTRRLKAAYWPA